MRVLLALILLFIFLSGALFYFGIPSSPELTQIQPFYRSQSLTYSPFPNISIDRYYYNKLNLTAIVADDNDFNRYNFTVCITSSPLEVRSEHFQVEGECSNNRLETNCYVDLNHHHTRSTDVQLYNLYMLHGSVITFNASGLADVQLCIASGLDVCRNVFRNDYLNMCKEVLTFNRANGYSQTFTARNAGYYCAVWLLNKSTQSLNYTANGTRRYFNISQCQTLQERSWTPAKQIKTTIFDLQRTIATKPHDPVFIAIKAVPSTELRNNITLVSTVVASKVNNLAFVFGVVFAFFMAIITTLFVIALLCNIFM